MEFDSCVVKGDNSYGGAVHVKIGNSVIGFSVDATVKFTGCTATKGGAIYIEVGAILTSSTKISIDTGCFDTTKPNLASEMHYGHMIYIEEKTTDADDNHVVDNDYELYT